MCVYIYIYISLFLSLFLPRIEFLSLSLPRIELSSKVGVWLFTTQWTVDHLIPLSVGFLRQEYWSDLPFPTPGDLLDPGIETASQPPALAGRFFTTGTTWAIVKNSSVNARGTRDTGSISGSGRSFGGGQGKLPSILAWRIPMDRGAWWAIVHRFAKSQTWLKQLGTHT